MKMSAVLTAMAMSGEKYVKMTFTINTSGVGTDNAMFSLTVESEHARKYQLGGTYTFVIE